MSVRFDVRAVVFDLDGTLLDRRRSFEGFIDDQWERFSTHLVSVDRDAYVRILIERDRDGYAPRKELFAGLVAQFALPSGLAHTLLADYRAGFPAGCVLFPDVRDTLQSLRGAGFKLGLITNGSVRMQSRKIECLGLSSVFDAALISDAEGVSKPNPEIFHRALRRLDVDPSRSVYVGDNPEVDIAGARGAGMRTVWRRDALASQLADADATIEDVRDLLALLEIPGTGHSQSRT